MIPEQDVADSQRNAVRRDIIHTLCFKALSFSDLSARLTERVQDYPGFQDVLESLTVYRPPEGLHDSGMFELRPEYLEELDPYNSGFNKNQRDEAESIYRRWVAKKVNKPEDDIVFEPRLRSISTGAYVDLAAFTSKALFAQFIYNSLLYAVRASSDLREVTLTRVEAYIHVVLQLVLIAALEDDVDENDFTEDSMESFIRHSLFTPFGLDRECPDMSRSTIVALLREISTMDEFQSCRSKIKHILRMFCRQRRRDFDQATRDFEFPYGRLDTASPANLGSEIEAKKKQALDRKAKVMAQFQKQQQSFMDNQGMLDWGEDDPDEPAAEDPQQEAKSWKFPTGVCIQCREETNDARLFGTFTMLVESNVLRQTSVDDPDWIEEVLIMPRNLDASIEDSRPFGVAGENHEEVKRLTSDGQEIVTDRQGLGRGWPIDHVMRGPVSTGCGHLMHFVCFENYCHSVSRRQNYQIARNHPERTQQKEFVCPLCKALGNAFLPIIWKSTEEAYPGALSNDAPLDNFLDTGLPPKLELQRNYVEKKEPVAVHVHAETLERFTAGNFAPVIAQWQRGEIPISPTGLSWAQRPELSSFSELTRIYIRLRDTLNIIQQDPLTELSRPGTQLDNLESLVTILARTIAAREIAQRGLPSEKGQTLLEKMSQQTLTHLRILAETTKSYAALGAMTIQVPIKTGDFRSVQPRLFRQLFVAYAQDGMMSTARVQPMLLDDGFTFLTKASLVLCPVLQIDIRHALHLCYVADIIRVALIYMARPAAMSAACHRVITRHRMRLDDREIIASSMAVQGMSSLVKWIKTECSNSSWTIEYRDISDEECGVLYQLLRGYALAFLRKAMILLHVSHGVTFPLSSSPEACELDRLSGLLRLPTLADLVTDFAEYSGKAALKSLSAGWIHHLADFNRSRQLQRGCDPVLLTHEMKILHPCPLELIGLPKYYDALMEETQRRKCPTTGKELIDPSICLFCGEIFCSQAVCCTKDGRRGKRGGCNLHIDKYVQEQPSGTDADTL